MAANVDMKRIFRILKRNMDAALSDKEMKKLGEMAAKMIKVRTRLGFGIVGSGRNIRRKKLKGLAQSTIDRRAKAKLNGETTPKRSNLTFTGQLINSLKVTSVSNGKVTINATGSRSDAKIDNEELAEIHETGGPRLPRRRFLDLTVPEEKKLNRFYRKNLGDLLRKNLT